MKILVLGTAEWDQAIATNQHYAVRELAREHEVMYVESMGLRRVEFGRRDLRRVIGRLLRRAAPRARSSRPRPDGVEVISPLVLPWHRGLPRQINRLLLRKQVQSWRSSTAQKVLWLYTPVDYDLRREADASVYHCVDLLGTVPGIDSALIADSESALARDNSVVAAGSSPRVVQHLRAIGFHEVHDWPNVADVETIARAEAGVRYPGVVFAGNLTVTKVDFQLIAQLIASGVDVHLAGPISEGGGNDRESVKSLVSGGAVYHGLLSLPELAVLYHSCTVGIIPYVENEYTRGVNPLKTYEYLAAGLRVISTGVPAVIPVPGHVDTPKREEFVESVVEAVRQGPPAVDHTQERSRLAQDNSWTERGTQMRALLGDMRKTRASGE